MNEINVPIKGIKWNVYSTRGENETWVGSVMTHSLPDRGDLSLIMLRREPALFNT